MGPSAEFMGLTSQVQTRWSGNSESEKTIRRGNGLALSLIKGTARIVSSPLP